MSVLSTQWHFPQKSCPPVTINSQQKVDTKEEKVFPIAQQHHLYVYIPNIYTFIHQSKQMWSVLILSGYILANQHRSIKEN